jgi:hypothetical protein
VLPSAETAKTGNSGVGTATSTVVASLTGWTGWTGWTASSPPAASTRLPLDKNAAGSVVRVGRGSSLPSLSLNA